MKRLNQYFFEYLLVAVTLVVSVLGFWAIYFGANAAPQPHHHLHLVANFAWMFLLLYQLRLLDTKRFSEHRKVGLSILFFGPVLFASVAYLAVHSAHKGVVSGEGDMLIAQNVPGTIELGLLILLAFILRKRRKLHGALLMSTNITFLGIALFFTLLTFVFTSSAQGPEAMDRFAASGMTAQITAIAVGFLMFLKDFRNNWPYFLAGLFFVINGLFGAWLTSSKLIGPFTEFIGSLSKPVTFAGSFVLLLALLLATGVLKSAKLSPAAVRS